MTLSREIREKAYNKHNGKCGYCGISIQYHEMQVDHIIPQSNFKHHVLNKWRLPKFLEHLTVDDKNHIDNLMPTCRVCNKWKSNFDLELFRKELEEQVKRLNEYSGNYRIAKKYSLVIEDIKPVVFYFESVNIKKDKA